MTANFIQRNSRKIALFFLLNFVFSLFQPSLLFALSGGPTQPEFSGFQPVTATDLVDPFTGDVSYNVPLFEIGGYPINLAYNGAPNMEGEASWVGFGWTLNPGAVNRDVRGIPDDFKGDIIQKNVNVRPNWTVGVSGSFSTEVFAKDMKNNIPKADSLKINLGASLTITYNNYNGIGIERGMNVSSSLNSKGANALGFNGNLGISNGPNGFSSNMNLGLSFEREKVAGGIGIGGGFNSRAGLNELTVNANIKPVSDKSASSKNKIAQKIDKIVSGKKYGKSNTADMATISTSGSLLSFGHSPAFQTPVLPFENKAYTFRATLGSEVFGTHGNMSFRGFYNVQKLKEDTLTNPAFGSIYSQDQKVNSISDYAKEKEVPLNSTTTHLAMPYMTSDMYGVMAHGVNGQYRIKRSDNGVYHKPINENTASGLTIGVEVGAGNIFHGGVDITTPTVENKSSKWIDLNIISKLNIFDSFQNDTFQPAYLYNNQETQLFQFNEDEANIVSATAPNTVKLGQELFLSGMFTNSKMPLDYESKERLASKTAMSYLTAIQSSRVGYQKVIKSYPLNTKVYANVNQEQIDSISRLDHNMDHISEITVTKEDGMRYIFGIPTYNIKKIESTFNLGIKDQGSAFTNYSPNSDNSTGNLNGKDRFFDQTITPEYATSYLLTAVATPNYVDLTGNGISSDDIGDVVQFNYTRVYKDYKWRTPYSLNSVNHSPGHMVIDDDSKGSYIYGEKEIWLNHSIESKDQIAFFYASNANRLDAIEPKDENGGLDANSPRKMFRLDSVVIFSKAELISNPTTPTPIKTVIFEYQYNLFPGAPNSLNGAGKQILSKVYFTYGKNRKGKLNPYVFDYVKDIDGSVVDYQEGATDRWGNIKLYNSNGLPLNTYPYAEQSKELQDKFCSLGMLKSIELPSGSLIEIDYESDDYSIVNDLPAAQMQIIAGIGESPDFSEANDELNSVNLIAANPKNHVFFEVPEDITTKELLEKYYLNGLYKEGSHLYFDFAVDLADEDKFDRIKGYFELRDWGVTTHEGQNYGWLRIESVPEQSDNLQPVSLAALQKLRLEIPEKAYPGSFLDLEEPDALQVATMIGGNIGNYLDLLIGFNKVRLLENKCNQVNLDHSWIRLKEPNRRKLGGGNRVKEVKVSDLLSPNYYKLVSGQKYDYTLGDPELPRSKFSSGVACYEPILGGEENPSRIAIGKAQKVKLAPSNFYYSELPIGEQLFPAPVVGYSRVKITPYGVNGIRDAGYSIKEFYTSKDFPTIVDATAIDAHPQLKSPKKLFNTNNDTYFSAVQGYSVVVNDMHGKPKFDKTFNSENTLLTQTEFQYNIMPAGSNAKQMISSKVKIVDRNGNISDGYLGLDVEHYIEMDEASTTSSTPGMMGNIDVSMWGPIAVPLYIPLNLFSRATQTTRTGVITKFIKKAGILSKIIVTNEGEAKVETENLLFDKHSGNLLLTSTMDGYGEKIYSLNIPAYWNYDLMGLSTDNVGLEFNDVSILNVNSISKINNSTVAKCLREGDEIFIRQSNAEDFAGYPYKYYAMKIGNDLVLANSDNQPLNSTNYDFKIIRSGNRNLIGQPLQTIQSRKNPINSALNKLDIEGSQENFVLNASAAEYDDYSKIDCDKQIKYTCEYDPKIRESEDEIFGHLVDALIQYSRFYSGPQISSMDSLLDFYEEQTDFELPNSIRGALEGFTISELPPPNQTPFINLKIAGGCEVSLIPTNFNALKYRFFNSAYVGATRTTASCTELPSQQIYNPCPTTPMDFVQTMDNISRYIPISMVGASGLPTNIGTAVITCVSCTSQCIPMTVNETINPYARGLKGNWAPLRSYVFMSERSRELNDQVTDIENTGFLKGWTPYWTFDQTSGGKLKKNVGTNNTVEKWTWPSEITLKDNKGNALEERDTINRFSAALFSYDNNFNTAVASNSRYQQIANDHFEDYGFDNDQSEPCFMGHWSFKEILAVNESIDTISSDAHTGSYSLKLLANSSASLIREIESTAYQKQLERNESGQYLIKRGDCIKKFSPLAGDYIVSGWVKPINGCSSDPVSAKITVSGADGTTDFYPSGPTIDGWQRIEGTFSVSSSQTQVTVSLENEESFVVLYDDLRIHPKKSNMKTFVYNSTSLKLMATLDENNYATFYEYDSEGKLIRIKKETERGIVTLKENRQSLYRPGF